MGEKGKVGDRRSKLSVLIHQLRSVGMTILKSYGFMLLMARTMSFLELCPLFWAAFLSDSDEAEDEPRGRLEDSEF